MNRRWFMPAACALMICFAGAVNAKPNFSGDWKASIDKCDFGPMPPPSAMTAKIKHDDPEMNISSTQSTDQGERSFETKYSTDGKETANKFGPMDTKSTAVWEGDALMVTTKLDFQGSEITIKEKWTLSEDGKTLKRVGHIAGPQGEFDVTYVFEKK